MVDGSLRQQPSTSKHASALDLTAAQACSVPDESMCSETVVDTDKHSVTMVDFIERPRYRSTSRRD